MRCSHFVRGNYLLFSDQVSKNPTSFWAIISLDILQPSSEARIFLKNKLESLTRWEYPFYNQFNQLCQFGLELAIHFPFLSFLRCLKIKLIKVHYGAIFSCYHLHRFCFSFDWKHSGQAVIFYQEQTLCSAHMHMHIWLLSKKSKKNQKKRVSLFSRHPLTHMQVS